MKWHDASDNLRKIAAVHRKAIDEGNKKVETEAVGLADEIVNKIGLQGVNVALFLAGFWPPRAREARP